MEPVLLAKRFSYEGHPGSKGVLFDGALFVDRDGLYLFHARETRQSEVVAMAVFGVFGLLVQRLIARAKTPVEHPFETTPVGDLPAEVLSLFACVKLKPETQFSMVDREQVSGTSRGFLRGAAIRVGHIVIKPASPRRAVWGQLPTLGYLEGGAEAD